MSISYDPLWRMLSDSGINKMDFARKIKISNATLAKLGKDESVALPIIEKICKEFNCKIENVIEYYPDKAIEQTEYDELAIGTIVVCPCYPLNSKSDTVMHCRSELPNKCNCVILTSNEYKEKNYIYLIAPIKCISQPETVFDVKFKNIPYNNKVLNGYIQVGKVGSINSSHIESTLGAFPSFYIEEARNVLREIKPLITKSVRMYNMFKRGSSDI